MNEALAPKGYEVGLRRTPIVQLLRPFACAPKVEDALAGQDNGAVDDPNQDRRDVTCRNADHCVIEECDSFGGSLQPDKGLAFAQQRQSQQIAVGKTVSQYDGLIACRAGSLALASEHGQKAIEDEYITPFDTVTAVIIEKPLGARQPAGSVRRFPSEQMGQAKPEPPPSGRAEGVPTDAEMMQSGPRCHRLSILTHQVGSCRQTLQIIGFERRYLIRRRQLSEGAGPLLTIECRPGPIKFVGRSHDSI